MLSQRRLDVLIEAEKIRWVILVLHGDETLIRLRIIGRSHPLLSLVTEKVDIDPTSREGLHCGPEVACPSDVSGRFLCVGPHRVDVQEKWCIAVDVGRLIVVNSADGPLKMSEQHFREGRRSLSHIVDYRIDGLIAIAFEVLRLPIVESPWGIGRVEERLDLCIRFGPDQIHLGRTEGSQRVEDALTFFRLSRVADEDIQN